MVCVVLPGISSVTVFNAWLTFPKFPVFDDDVILIILAGFGGGCVQLHF